MSQKVSKKEYASLARFRYAIRRFLHFSEEAAKEKGLTPQQHQALLGIVGFKAKSNINLSDLAEFLQIKHQSAVGLANRLERSGLVSRQKSDSDKRQIYLSLTAKGEKILAELTDVHRDEVKVIQSELSHLLNTDK